jgi:hypothetical protein
LRYEPGDLFRGDPCGDEKEENQVGSLFFTSRIKPREKPSVDGSLIGFPF